MTDDEIDALIEKWQEGDSNDEEIDGLTEIVRELQHQRKLDRSMALLISDSLEFTNRISHEMKQDAIGALRLLARGGLTEENERDIFKNLLDNGWITTASMTEEFARALLGEKGEQGGN